MSAVVASVIAALSAFAAVVSVVLYAYFGRRSELANAREEALALAETRRQVIGDLRRRVESLERRHKRTKAECERRVVSCKRHSTRRGCKRAKEAYRTQHFYSTAFSDLLNDVRSDLERIPPDVGAALVRIRKLLAGERPAA